MMWQVRKGWSDKLVDANRWKNRRDGLFDLTSPVEPSKSKIWGTIMMEEVSEELPEERTLVNFFPHWAISTRPRPSNKTVGSSQQTGWKKRMSCLDFPWSWSLFLPLSFIFCLMFCHSAFNHALSRPVLLYQSRMIGRKETWLGQAGDIPCRQELCSWPAVTTVTGYSKLFSKTGQLFHSLKSSATATAPLLSTLLSFMLFLSIFIIKSSKSIFTPIVVIWEMNKKIKPFLLC